VSFGLWCGFLLILHKLLNLLGLLSSGVECQQGWPPLQIPRGHDYQSQIAEHMALETIILIVIVNVCLSFLRIVRPDIHHILNGNCNFIGTKTLLKLN
jgi:hypothetical protein